MRFLFSLLGASVMGAPALIPIPVSVQTCPGEYTFDRLRPDIDSHFAGLEKRLADRIPVGDSPYTLRIRLGAFTTGEAYSLSVGWSGIDIVAPTSIGAMHAIETLVQWKSGNQYACVTIEDRPRFPWRGVLIDTSRHFMPIDVLERTIDRMAAVKLNVLHLHLADDQGVRIESKRYPLLQQKASGGQYYTQEQIKSLIGYAGERGIRIVPEFDFPGHATAWFAAYPDLASAPGPYAIERRIGIFDPAFDPSNPRTYEFIEGFLTEMVQLFPDDYVHLGGDEVTGKHWDANPRIQAFKKAQGLASNHELQIYFEDRMHRIVSKLGKKLVLWDEAIHPKASADIVYQAWRGPNALLASTFLKHPTLVSYGFYLDWGLSTEQLYRNQLNGVLPDETDPILKRLNPLIKIPASRPVGMLTEAEAANRMGGEAALWSEFTTPANIETRLWPRAAVVAERLWSPAEKSQDVDDLYRRLRLVFSHPKARTPEELLEPGKYVFRHLSHKYTVESAMDELVDMLPPESLSAQEFNRAVRNHQYDRARTMLTEWKAIQNEVQAVDSVLNFDAWRVIKIGLDALNYLDRKSKPAPANWVSASRILLTKLGDNHREIVVAICPGVLDLVNAYDSAARSAPQ